MGTLSKEFHNINNPALGAIILWRFISGYETGSNVKAPTPLPLIFIVLPMILHPEILGFVKSTNKRSGLRAFAGKFSNAATSKSDIIFSIQKRAIDLRGLTRSSMQVAIASDLIALNPNSGEIFSLSITPPAIPVSQDVDSMFKESEKLGIWCSQVTLHEISIILKVEF